MGRVSRGACDAIEGDIDLGQCDCDLVFFTTLLNLLSYPILSYPLSPSPSPLPPKHKQQLLS